MVLLATTPNILSALESLSSSSREELSLTTEPVLEAPISHTQLISLSRHLSKKGGGSKGNEDTDSGTNEKRSTFIGNASASPTRYSLDFLLRGTHVYVPPPPPKPEPSVEYLALKSRLQAAAEADAYNNLLQQGPLSGATHSSPLFPKSSHLHLSVPSLNNDAKAEDEDPLTLSLVLNILLSVVLTGFSTYWAVSHFRLPSFLLFIFSSPSTLKTSSLLSHESYPGSRSSGPARVFISLAAAILVGVAEVVIYAAYLRKVKVARDKERRIPEKKAMFVVDPKLAEEAKVNSGKKEEIWGRGVNGGVRRRVREKWEDKEGRTSRLD